MKRKPHWLKKPIGLEYQTSEVRELIKTEGLNTVCSSARCPNIGECFQRKTATFMILGERCTRNCGFCNVKNGRPEPVDTNEPHRVARACKNLGLKYAVVTSVTRDDLSDHGAGQFAESVVKIREQNPGISIELLTPDFGGIKSCIDIVINAKPDVYNHNLETVPSLYKTVRPSALYQRSLDLLAHVKKSGIPTKSGIMVGFGESDEELSQLFSDLADIDCDMLTIGQYLQPSRKHLPVVEYVPPEKFDKLEQMATTAGIKKVYAGSYVRSSYRADTGRIS